MSRRRNRHDRRNRRDRRDAGNDKRTKKGKVYAGSNGKSRPRKPGGAKGPVDPCIRGVGFSHLDRLAQR